MKKSLLVIPVFFILSLAIAQTPTPDAYRKAQSELEAKNYWDAIPLFKQFTDSKEYGNLANYAAFHLGEALLGANQPAQAVAALKPIVGGNWAKSDDAKYLLAIAYFKNQQNIQALQIINKIKDDGVMKMAENATYENLKKVSVSFMIANLSEFKDNKGYGEALKDVLESQTILSAAERNAYYELQGKANETRKGVKDQILDIVVILPFTNSSRTNLSSIPQNDFVFELYQGLKYGVEQLEINGTKVNMLTFDSKRDVLHLQKLLADPAIASADIIIGPIYPEETDLVSSFAETARIPFVHPLSNLGDRFEELNYSYLFRPAASSIASGIVEGLKKQNWGKKVAIGYSASSRDEMLAKMLQDQLGKAGFQLLKFEQITPRNTSTFLQGLGIRSGQSRSTVDQVILLSDDPSIAQPAYSLMESISASIPILVMDSWLGFNFANYEMLKSSNFYFIGNNSLNFYGESMQQFRNRFYSKNLIYPSLNTALGAELINWVSSNMSDSKGFDLRRNLDQNAYQAGKLTWGFNFQGTHNNQYVPLFTLEAGELKPLD
ncbi:substrate-binding family protein [Algoriphagus ratkowskyi]|uniref:ABC transporter substrate-binding protein n=1 Tax=Algoriphagus ratkowskyi TaxID=57028 RepID=A0A2W7RJR9_9BACT|nr:ABC transporter substrate-binding protein [Algoriphagus ratkowskyi]PZX61098.1 substrate-binding family protein [Algoriphagus ratkowskyi]TXD79230.1 ABC transporter substrate-binding protein [Algoriphagus ratkowskyi]